MILNCRRQKKESHIFKDFHLFLHTTIYICVFILFSRSHCVDSLVLPATSFSFTISASQKNSLFRRRRRNPPLMHRYRSPTAGVQLNNILESSRGTSSSRFNSGSSNHPLTKRYAHPQHDDGENSSENGSSNVRMESDKSSQHYQYTNNYSNNNSNSNINGDVAPSFRQKSAKTSHKLRQSDEAILSIAEAESTVYDELQQLQTENDKLRAALRRAELENERLQHQISGRIIIETFEGEGKFRQQQQHTYEKDSVATSATIATTMSGEEMLTECDLELQPLWCDELEDGSCPIEPSINFGEALRDRAYWLVGLLVLQSCSGIILSRNEALLANHPVIIYFLTMLVGAGGNAGNQASVRVIRGLALNTLNEQTQNQFLIRELKMACALSGILSLAGFLRAIAFRTPLPETIAVTTALFIIVFSSICLGAILPLILKRLGIDPAHSSTTIQVVMDILGVFLTVVVSGLLLDSPLRGFLASRLGLGDI